MFVVLRKNNIILLACIMLVSFYTLSLWQNRAAEPAEEAAAAFAAPASGRVIVIDAGHGETAYAK